MIGILIVTHCGLGDAIIDAAKFVLDEKLDFVQSISVNLNENVDELRNKIIEGLKKVDNKAGIIILTDMFGGTPSNISYSFLEENHIDVISGVNLPMMIRAVKNRENKSLLDFSVDLEEFGKKSISLASRILKGNKRGD